VILGRRVVLYILIIVGLQVFIDEGSNSTWLYHTIPERFEKGTKFEEC